MYNIPRWRGGVFACLDFAVTSGLRSKVLVRSASDSQSVLIDYRDCECAHLDTKRHCEREGVTFIPRIINIKVVGDTWGPQEHKMWSALAKSKASGEQESAMANRIFQNLGNITPAWAVDREFFNIYLYIYNI